MISLVIWKRSLDSQYRDEEETGGGRDLVLPEDAENSLDSKENQSRSAAECESRQGADDCNNEDRLASWDTY